MWYTDKRHFMGADVPHNCVCVADFSLHSKVNTEYEWYAKINKYSKIHLYNKYNAQKDTVRTLVY